MINRMLSRPRTPLFWSIALAAGYAILAAVVTAAEYFSEMSKIDRGIYTDTFSSFLLTQLLTFPTSQLVAEWPGYPPAFEDDRYRDVVRDALWPMGLSILLQALVAGAVIWLVASVLRRRRTQPFMTA